jgi:hypothetical protein
MNDEDRDLVWRTMQEAKRLSSEPVGPNPFEREPAIETLLEVPTHYQEQKTMANQDRAIHLRWALRDIKGKRMKLSPVSPDDLRTLIEMGLRDAERFSGTYKRGVCRDRLSEPGL